MVGTLDNEARDGVTYQVGCLQIVLLEPTWLGFLQSVSHKLANPSPRPNRIVLPRGCGGKWDQNDDFSRIYSRGGSIESVVVRTDRINESTRHLPLVSNMWIALPNLVIANTLYWRYGKSA